MTFDFVNFITIPEPKIGEVNLFAVNQFKNEFKILLNEQHADHSIIPLQSDFDCIRSELSPNFALNIGSTFEDFVREAEAAGFRLRDSMAWATPVGHPFAIRHPEAVSARRTFELNWLAAAAWESETATLIWRYVLCLWCHIFIDGNGHLARRFLAAGLCKLDYSKGDDFYLCFQLARDIHADIKNQLVVMESQNSRCWLTGTFELLSASVSKMMINGHFSI